jgi:hypothetical protein
MTTKPEIDLRSFIAAVAAGDWPLPTNEDMATKRECYDAMKTMLGGLNIGQILGATATAIRNLGEFQERLIEDVLFLAEDDERTAVIMSREDRNAR